MRKKLLIGLACLIVVGGGGGTFYALSSYSSAPTQVQVASKTTKEVTNKNDSANKENENDTSTNVSKSETTLTPTVNTTTDETQAIDTTTTKSPNTQTASATPATSANTTKTNTTESGSTTLKSSEQSNQASNQTTYGESTNSKDQYNSTTNEENSGTSVQQTEYVSNSAIEGALVYKEPNTNSEQLMRLFPGTTVFVVSENNGWDYVRGSSTTYGYVPAQYIQGTRPTEQSQTDNNQQTETSPATSTSQYRTVDKVGQLLVTSDLYGSASYDGKVVFSNVPQYTKFEVKYADGPWYLVSYEGNIVYVPSKRVGLFYN